MSGARLAPAQIRGVFQQGEPLDTRQAYQPSCSSQHEHAEAKPLQCSWPPQRHRGQCRQIREALREAVSSLAGIAGFAVFTEPLGSICTRHLEPGGQTTTGTPGLPLPSSSLINLVYEANSQYYLQNKAGFESTATCTCSPAPSLTGSAVPQLALHPQHAYTAAQIILSQGTERCLHDVSKKPQVLIFYMQKMFLMYSEAISFSSAKILWAHSNQVRCAEIRIQLD